MYSQGGGPNSLRLLATLSVLCADGRRDGGETGKGTSAMLRQRNNPAGLMGFLQPACAPGSRSATIGEGIKAVERIKTLGPCNI